MNYSPGDKLADRFELIERIGEGGMGQIFRAQDSVAGRECAVKVLHGLFEDDAKARERVENEAEIAISLAALRPDLFPEIHAVVFEIRSEALLIAMELINGHNLLDIVKAAPDGQLPPLEAVRIGLKILEAMQVMYLRGIVTRDLTLENVIVGGNGTVKVTDFGIAKNRRRNREVPGTVMGTPEYIAPEYICGQAGDHRADLYSFGILLYRLVAGEFPFNAFYTHRMLDDHLMRPPPALPAEVPEPLQRIIMKLLEKYPRDRYQTPQEAAQELAAFAVGLDPSLRTKEPYYSLLGRATDEFAVRDSRFSPPETPGVSASRNGTLAFLITAVKRMVARIFPHYAT